VLAIGDDYTDENMFKAVPDWAYTLKVGLGLTAARYRIKNVSAVVSLLTKLTR
jgi:trehalose 6-phosphate synthase/phosphatase